MPNLEQHAVTAWLTELRPDPACQEWPPAIRALETHDGVPERLAALGVALDGLDRENLADLGIALQASPLRDDLSTVMAQLGAGRVLRLLHWLSEADVPECHAVIGALLQEDDDSGRALRAAIAAVTRRATLRRIFAADRIVELERACPATFQEAA